MPKLFLICGQRKDRYLKVSQTPLEIATRMRNLNLDDANYNVNLDKVIAVLKAI